jgi:hypothetical protein
MNVVIQMVIGGKGRGRNGMQWGVGIFLENFDGMLRIGCFVGKYKGFWVKLLRKPPRKE